MALVNQARTSSWSPRAPASHPNWDQPFPAGLPDPKGPSFPEKALLGFQEGSGDRERKPQMLITLITGSPLGQHPPRSDAVVTREGLGTELHTLHFILKPPSGSERGGPGTETSWQSWVRDALGPSGLGGPEVTCWPLQRLDQSCWWGWPGPSSTLLTEVSLEGHWGAQGPASSSVPGNREPQLGRESRTVCFCVSEDGLAEGWKDPTLCAS